MEHEGTYVHNCLPPIPTHSQINPLYSLLATYCIFILILQRDFIIPCAPIPGKPVWSIRLCLLPLAGTCHSLTFEYKGVEHLLEHGPA